MAAIGVVPHHCIVCRARGSSNGRTPPFGGGYRGSNPCPRARHMEAGSLGRVCETGDEASPRPARANPGPGAKRHSSNTVEFCGTLRTYGKSCADHYSDGPGDYRHVLAHESPLNADYLLRRGR